MADEKDQYRSVLKASSLIGGSALINILIGMVRTKFTAVLIGPVGVGLAGMYGTLLNPIAQIAGMGISTSGVRQIAEAHGTGNSRRVAEVIKTLRRTVWGTGALGGAITVALCPWLSRWTFGTYEHALPIAILGATILFGNIAIGQSCVLQGTRRIRDLTAMQVVGAVNGALIGIPCLCLWRIKGILPSLVLSSLATMITAWWFARRVKLESVIVSRADSVKEVKRLLGFGLPLMASGLQVGMAAYLIRIVIIKGFGLAGVGIWGAAYNVSGLLANFVLNAMGTDYYPRLTAVAHDKQMVSKEVNNQTEIALLLATPALLATILFAPLGIQLLYSGRFDAAIPVLRWFVYGVFGRVVSWPLSFIILAQGRGRLFLATEMSMNIVYLGLVYVCSKWLGLPGTGLAFLLQYVIYIGVIVVVAQRISETHWTLANSLLIAGITVLLVGAGLLHVCVASSVAYYTLATLLVVGITYVAMRQLSLRAGITLRSLRQRFTK